MKSTRTIPTGSFIPFATAFFVSLILFFAGHLASAEGTELKWGPAESGISLNASESGKVLPLVKSLVLRVKFADGSSFETRGLKSSKTPGGGLRLDFDLGGTAASDASVSADLFPAKRSLRMKWRVKYTGEKKEIREKAIQFEFAKTVQSARSAAVTKFVKPTGAEEWEAVGDTPYPDFDVQVRRIHFEDQDLAAVTSWYDSGWIYGNDFSKARTMAIPLTNRSPVESEFDLALIALSKGDTSTDGDLAAEGKGRPISLSAECDSPYHLFKPGEDVSFRLRLRNVSGQSLETKLNVLCKDYYGESLASDNRSVKLEPGQSEKIPFRFKYSKRGIAFLAAEVSAGGENVILRTTFGILPERALTPVKPASVFGMAAIIGRTNLYPDQVPPAESLALLARIGVRWLRGSHQVDLKTNHSAADLALAQDYVALQNRYGIRPYFQAPSAKIPLSKDVSTAFFDKVRETISTYKDLFPYMEFGNEKNLTGETGANYAQKILKPLSELSRSLHPKGTILSMGLGGVQKNWLDDFVNASGMASIDILSIHPGCHPRAPEFWNGNRGWVFKSQVMDAVQAAESAGKSVWITEAYAPSGPMKTQSDLRTAADYLVRTHVVAIALGVKMVAWYQFQDGTWFANRYKPTDLEYYYGMTFTDLTPKPQYPAYGVMTEQLEDASCAGRLKLGDDNLYGVRFRRGGETIDVLWSYKERPANDTLETKGTTRFIGEPWEEKWKSPVEVSLPASGSVVVTDLMGNEKRVNAGGILKLKLSGSPVYVRGLGNIPLETKFWGE
ncbi:MAG: hypothetical protein JNM63_18275 [Spirochaetia bacterium]|nr:hypothetical protein [Spirochaetia bacterium]